MDREWLKGLKVGDEVAVAGGVFGVPRLFRIARETSKQFIITDGRRYWKRDGYLVSSSARRSRLMEVTDDVLDKIERDNVRWRVSTIDCTNLTTDQLRRIVAILDESKTEETSGM